MWFNRTKPGTTGLIGTVKDEGPWLIEWIAHHKAIGFDEIAIASNDCSDGTDDILDHMAQMGLLTHLDNRPPYRNNIQLAAYYKLQMLSQMRACEWLMAIDADEFVTISEGGGHVQDLIAAAGNVDRILLRWRLFGDSGIAGYIDPPITEKLYSAAKPDDPANDFVKSLTRGHHLYEMGIHLTTAFRPAARFGPQRFRKLKLFYEGNTVLYQQGGGAKRLKAQLAEIGHRNTVGQINHYAVRTREICALRIKRGDATRDGVIRDPNDKYFARLNINHVKDRSADAYAQRRSALMSDWLADETLARLHTKSVEITKTRIAKAVQNLSDTALSE